MSEAEQQGSRPLKIDFHIHMAQYARYQPWVPEWIGRSIQGGFDDFVDRYGDPGAFDEMLAQEGIDYACILADICPVTTGVCTNEAVRDFCRGRPRLLPFCDLNPHVYNAPGDELRRLVEEEGFRGIKLYPVYQHVYPNDPKLYPLYQAAQDLGVPVLVHTGSSVFKGARIKYGDPLHLDDVAVDFPELNLVMAHSGRGFWYDRAFFLSRHHDNLYMELAGLPPSRLLTYFPELTRNADKVIFGSDWPGMPSIRRNMEAISELGFTETALEKVLGGNAARLLGL